MSAVAGVASGERFYDISIERTLHTFPYFSGTGPAQRLQRPAPPNTRDSRRHVSRGFTHALYAGRRPSRMTPQYTSSPRVRRSLHAG